MKISIITVSFNSQTSIARTIQSVLAQNGCQIEYLIIDGASKDNTVSIANSYAPKFAEKNIDYQVISEPDKGMYDAMNKGILKATGDIIGILNSDDYYANANVLSDVVSSFESHNCSCVYGNLLIAKNDKPYRYWSAGKCRSFSCGWMAPHPAFFVKKEVYTQFGSFRLDCGINADYELMLRLLHINKCSSFWINKTLTIMSAGGASDSGINSRLTSITDNKYAWTINGLRCPPLAVYLKKLRKLPQFIKAKFIKMN